MSQKFRIAVLIEGDFYENEIFYYQHRFAEESMDLVFLTRLWGQISLTFLGHEFRASLSCNQSFEGVDPGTFDAIIVPAGMVADRLRYTDRVDQIPPACEFMRQAFLNPKVIKGIICHGMWLMAPIAEVIHGRKAVVHNNLLGDAKAYGIDYQNQDLVIDGDLITARTGGHCHLLARAIIDTLQKRF